MDAFKRQSSGIESERENHTYFLGWCNSFQFHNLFFLCLVRLIEDSFIITSLKTWTPWHLAWGLNRKENVIFQWLLLIIKLCHQRLDVLPSSWIKSLDTMAQQADQLINATCPHVIICELALSLIIPSLYFMYFQNMFLKAHNNSWRCKLQLSKVL